MKFCHPTYEDMRPGDTPPWQEQNLGQVSMQHEQTQSDCCRREDGTDLERSTPSEIPIEDFARFCKLHAHQADLALFTQLVAHSCRLFVI